MLVKSVFRAVKPLVPVSLYRYLSFGYRAGLRRAVQTLSERDPADIQALGNPIVPHADLRVRVAGPCTVSEFLEAGKSIRASLESALNHVGRSFSDCDAVLDFGCGCGRAILAFDDPQDRPARIVGCDIDAEAIAWDREHIPFGEFHVNGHRPQLPFDDNTFDVVWTISVFTHLNEVDQFLWLSELRRVLKPDGMLLASVHGQHCLERYPLWVRRKVHKTGFLYARMDAEADWFPSWYQVAWHSRDYIQQEWSRILNVRAYLNQGLNNYHDLVVAQKQTTAARQAPLTAIHKAA